MSYNQMNINDCFSPFATPEWLKNNDIRRDKKVQQNRPRNLDINSFQSDDLIVDDSN